MANFDLAYEKLKKLEYSNKEHLFLHKNFGESDVTLGGIYKKFNSEALDWTFINNICNVCGYDLHQVLEIEAEKKQLKQQEAVGQAEQLIQDRINELDFKLKDYNDKLKRVSVMLYNDTKTTNQVKLFFKSQYWDKARLGEIHSQIKAEEVFLMGVVAGLTTAVKLAQNIVMAKPDGILGDNTLKALNMYDEDVFDRQYDNAEKNHFDLVIERNPHLAVNRDGWHLRAMFT